MKEEILEPFLRKMRIKRVLPYIKKYENCYMLDIGCGWNALLLKELEPYIKQGIGIDFKAPSIKTVKIETISASFEKTLPFDDEKFDVVTMLAVLEHLSYPEIILQEVQRILKPGRNMSIKMSRVYKINHSIVSGFKTTSRVTLHCLTSRDPHRSGYAR